MEGKESKSITFEKWKVKKDGQKNEEDKEERKKGLSKQRNIYRIKVRKK
jgi:hypothetical protein